MRKALNRSDRTRAGVGIGIGLILVLLAGADAVAQTGPSVTLNLGGDRDPGEITTTLQIVFLLTVLSLAPSLLIMTTCFTRIIVVFSLLRRALGTQQMPPNQLMVGLALFLTIFAMTPVWERINEEALQPYLREELSQRAAFQVGVEPIRTFMLQRTREKDLALFVRMSQTSKPRDGSEVPTRALLPAFAISELRMAFQIGFLLYIPFLVVDMIIAGILMAMGMMMLPPIMISLPFKLLLFVLVDGWYLIVQSLITPFR